jgi:hypothetical protein
MSHRTDFAHQVIQREAARSDLFLVKENCSETLKMDLGNGARPCEHASNPTQALSVGRASFSPGIVPILVAEQLLGDGVLGGEGAVTQFTPAPNRERVFAVSVERTCSAVAMIARLKDGQCVRWFVELHR